VQVSIHPSLEHWNTPELVELHRTSFVVEGACDQHIEVGIAGLSASLDEVGS
jgi:hypothetical protein